MICLVFTRKRLLIGVKGKITEFLRFKGKPYVDYNGRRMYDVFDTFFPHIIEEYFIYAQKNQLKLQKSIPVVLSFPSESMNSPTEQQIINNICDRINNTTFPKFSIKNKEALHTSYLRGIHLQEEILSEGCVVVEAIDGFPSLVYIYHPDEGLEGGHTVPIPRLGVKGSSQSLLQALELEFGKMGLSLNQEDRGSLLQQIQQQPPVDMFILNKSYGAAKMRLEVARDSLLVEDPLMVYQKIFKEWLNEAKLEVLGIKHLFLMGENLKQGIIRDCIDKTLYEETIIKLNEHTRNQIIWKFIVKGAFSNIPQPTQEIARREIATQEIPNEEISETPNGTYINGYYRQDATEVTPHEEPPKPNPQLDIKSSNTSLSFADQVIEKISPPPLQESPEPIILTPPPKKLRQEGTINVPHEKKQKETPLSWSARLGFQESKHPVNKTSENISFFDIYRVIKQSTGSAFHNYEVQDKINQGKYILKYIKKEELKEETLKEKFYHLFEKEKNYYNLKNNLELSKEGLYYLCPIVKGLSLKAIIQKNNIHEKKNLSDFRSSDLKLIVTVLETINNLNVSHCNLNEHNILVFKSINWKFRKEYFATVTEFTVEDCEKSTMIERVHQIFEKLLMQGVYKQLRQTLEL